MKIQAPAINPKFKMIFLAPIWGFRFFSLWRRARKYAKNPELMPIKERYEYILKLARKALKLYNVKIQLEGFDNLPSNGGVILAPNHKSNLDPLLLIVALAKQTEALDDVDRIPTFVAKEELVKKIGVGNALKLLDCVTINRENFRESLTKVLDFGTQVKSDHTFGIIFPEGTRVSGSELGEFKGGAFKTAQKNYLPVIPVAIVNSDGILEANKSGYQNVVVSFLKPLKPVSFIGQHSSAVGETVRKMVADEIAKYN